MRNELVRGVSIMEKPNGGCPLWGRAEVIKDGIIDLGSLKAMG